MKFSTALVFLACYHGTGVFAQDVRGGIERAKAFGREAPQQLSHNEIRPYWQADGKHLVYRVNSQRNGQRFFQVDLATGAKSEAFDHEALARALAGAAAQDVRAGALPLDDVQLAPEPGGLRFRALGKGWRFDATPPRVSAADVPAPPSSLMSPAEALRGSRHTGHATALTIENGTAGEIEIFWVDGGKRQVSYGKIPAGDSHTLATYAGHVWLASAPNGTPLAGIEAKDSPSLARVTGKVARTHPPARRDGLSPDGQWLASIKNHNLSLEPAAGGAAIALSSDGTPQDGYGGPLQWSPDSKKLIAWRAKEVRTRQIHIVESSPADQLQPKLLTLDYAKPGDPIRQPKPRLFEIGQRRQIAIDESLLDNPWEISHTAWSADSAEFSFVYNQRGHQVLRVLALGAESGALRTIVEERSKTFIDYSGKLYLHRLPDSRELLWASERDGFNHLYLIDEVSGQVKNQIVTGSCIVREVLEVDAHKRQLLLKVIGVPGQDPYHVHFARVNFDGSGFTRLTASDGNHRIEFSPDHQWLLDTWSRVDQPPVVEVRRAEFLVRQLHP